MRASIRNSIAPITPPVTTPAFKLSLFVLGFGLGVGSGSSSVCADTRKELFPMPTLFTAKTLIE